MTSGFDTETVEAVLAAARTQQASGADDAPADETQADITVEADETQADAAVEADESESTDEVKG